MRLWLTWFGAEMDSWLIFLGLKNEISPKDFPQTLLFIDEIQESKKAISFLRYFYEEAKVAIFMNTPLLLGKE